MLRYFVLIVATMAALLVPLHGQGDVKAPATKKQAESALKEFAKYYAKKNEHVRRAAVDGLGECNHKDTIKPLLAAMKDKSELVQGAVVVALSKQSTKPALAELTRKLQRGKPEVKVAILEAFKSTRPTVAFDTVLKLTDNKDFTVQYAAVQLLGMLEDQGDKAARRLLELTEDKAPQIRLTAIDALVERGHQAATDRCLELLEADKDWRVRASCIAALASFRLKRSIEPLIDAMEREKGRLQDDCHKALMQITGEDRPGRVESWRKWWTRVEARFKVPSDAELKERARKLAAAMAEYGRGGGKGYTPYYGIKTRSQRMVFIVDISGSMQDKVIFDSDDQEKVKKFKERFGDSEFKIDLAREQLINTIAGLKPYVKFNIVLFNTKVKKWKKSVVPANGGNINSAVKFLSKLTTDFVYREAVNANRGQTNTFDAINVAFGLSKEKKPKATKNHRVDADTVFLVTDGRPTAGRITDPDELLRYFRVINARAKMVFHTITFGHTNENLLQPMAVLSGGQFVVIAMD